MNIVLTGFMGVGKTVVGKLVAERLSFQFVDTDESIIKDVGMSISDIFSNKGEPYFREVESKIIELLGFADKTVIATGGGVPLRKRNMEELERNGMVVCLTAKPSTVYDRLHGDSTRPLLRKPDPMSEIEKLLKKREEPYKRCHLMIETDDLQPQQIADKIIKKFNEKNSGKTK